MNIKSIFAVVIIFCLVLVPNAVFAEDAKDASGGMKLNQLMKRLTQYGQTSLQRSDALKEYKGFSVRGVGKVTDIIKSPGESDKALVYLTKTYGNKIYELVLTVDADSVEKIKKYSYLKFVGNFEGMALETLRFDDAKILPKPFLWFF